MENNEKLDSKDFEILRELDTNFRQSFSKIGKKVRLSKNSVSLRFEKLKRYMLHNMTGLNNETMGYTLVKAFYSFDFYNDAMEKEIIKEARKHKNIIWVARYYGRYDIAIALLFDNLSDLVFQTNAFDEKFADRINNKEIEIVFKQYYFRYNFLHKKPIDWVSRIYKGQRKVALSKIDKKIIYTMLYEPRMNVIDVARKISITPKTISSRLRELGKSGVIMGYFMTLDPVKFNHNTFKLLIQLQNPRNSQEFEDYLSQIKNVKYFSKTLGMWDYEVDLIYPSITELQSQIELMKEKFPKSFKKIEIMSFGKRVFTNYANFLKPSDDN